MIHESAQWQDIRVASYCFGLVAWKEAQLLLLLLLSLRKEGRIGYPGGNTALCCLSACLLACLLDRLARIEISISIIITTYQFMTAIHTCRLHFSFFSLMEESEDLRGDHSG